MYLKYCVNLQLATLKFEASTRLTNHIDALFSQLIDLIAMAQGNLTQVRNEFRNLSSEEDTRPTALHS